MPIEIENTASNRTARLLLDDAGQFPRDNGNHAGQIVMPDQAVPEELIDYVVGVEHKLNLDDLRGQDAEAKMIRFEQGSVASFNIREHMLKTLVDQRKVERNPEVIARYGAELRRDIEDVKEYRIAKLATTAANYPGSNKAAGANFAAAGIRTLFNARANAIKAGGFQVTDWVMGPSTLAALANNPDIAKFFGSAAGGIVTEDVIKAYFRIPGQVVVAGYSRILGNDALPTEFWPTDFSLLISNRSTLSTRTFGLTGVMPYGSAFGRNGVLTDLREAKLPGVEQLSEVGACQRYTEALMNSTLGFLDTGVLGG